MLKVENRESAHLKSRVKDLSVVPNLVSYTALLAAITPIAKLEKNLATNLYEPVLVRDTTSLIENFGDPRIDPEKYIDLYTIMQMVGNGATVYLTKVNSGDAGVYHIDFGAKYTKETDSIVLNVVSGTANKKFNITGLPKEVVSVSYAGMDDNPSMLICEKNGATWDLTLTLDKSLSEDTLTVNSYYKAEGNTDISTAIDVYSSMTSNITIKTSVVQAKPTSLKAYYLYVELLNGGSMLGYAKIRLEDTTTNQSIVNVINANLGVYARFELKDKSTASACIKKEFGHNSIVKRVLHLANRYPLHNDDSALAFNNKYGLSSDSYGYAEVGSDNIEGEKIDFTSNIEVNGASFLGKELDKSVLTISEPNFKVTINDYVNALNQYKDRKYTGCLMADLVAPITSETLENVNTGDHFGVPSSEERRSLHFALHEIAVERKDVNLMLSTPMQNHMGDATLLTVNEVCDWTAAQGSTYETLWDYAQTNTTDYSEQGFYMEMYYSWLNMQCTWIDSGKAKSKKVMVAPSAFVVNNVLTSYRERGVHYPVAGDQYGKLPDGVVPVYNPATKSERDQLVQYRINPVYDTGTRGVQIYGNETLNAGYTDLNAAHIARTLVYLRSTIDEYTEKLKFSINSLILWDTWKSYVTNYILEPLKSAGALSSYSVAMGTDTTTQEEIANRMIKGNVSVTFYQSAEIFDLTYTVYSSATTVEAAQAAGY